MKKPPNLDRQPRCTPAACAHGVMTATLTLTGHRTASLKKQDVVLFQNAYLFLRGFDKTLTHSPHSDIEKAPSQVGRL